MSPELQPSPTAQCVELSVGDERRSTSSVRTASATCRNRSLGTISRAVILGASLVWLVTAGRHESALAQGIDTPSAAANGTHSTSVSLVNGHWYLNQKVTYRGTLAEGLLLNVRMVNAVFEDRQRPDFDANANTDEFILQIPNYVSHGVRAFTLNLQGGDPGYEGAINSAFNADGTLRESYLQRVRRVIEACDQHGAVIILGCFYQRQDQTLKDEQAVRAAVLNTARWIADSGFTNVLLEIANEYGHGGFDHQILKTTAGQIELIQLAKSSAPQLLVSTSGLGDGRLAMELAGAADFLMPHLNNTKLTDIAKQLTKLKPSGKPIVCNEDDKLGQAGAQAAETCVRHGCSWGFMHVRTNQHYPFAFQGPADDPLVYGELKRLTN